MYNECNLLDYFYNEMQYNFDDAENEKVAIKHLSYLSVVEC